MFAVVIVLAIVVALLIARFMVEITRRNEAQIERMYDGSTMRYQRGVFGDRAVTNDESDGAA
jgi:flagellar biosynthesis/type III secretory pathway M-ring protein FliF/YscJ